MPKKTFYLIFFLISSYLSASINYEFTSFRETMIIAPSLTISAYSLYKANNIEVTNIDDLSPQDINRFDRSAVGNYSERASNISDYLLHACIISPFALNFNHQIPTNANIIIGESYLVTSSLVYFSKTTFQRKRPYVYNNNIPTQTLQTKDSQYSFFSGHTALAFNGALLTAKIYDDFHPDKDNKYIYPIALSVASAVGVLRYKAGKHFPTDIITGAIVGTVSAFLITEVHKKGGNSNETNTTINFSFHF